MICLSIATGMGADPKAVLMACVIGGSCAYATPIGMPANIMVIGVGNYKFMDYVKAGLPLISNNKANFQEEIKMSNEAQVKKLTDIMAQFVGFTAKKHPDDVIAKLEELRSREDSPMATVRTPLRHNSVETFDEYNTGKNVGEGYEGITRFVLDRMTSYGLNACPPLLVGVGVGTSVETAALNSKKALMRSIGSHNDNANANAAKMERLLEDGINAIGLGPQGMGGHYSVMGVNIENMARHPSAIGVAVNVGCWEMISTRWFLSARRCP